MIRERMLNLDIGGIIYMPITLHTNQMNIRKDGVFTSFDTVSDKPIADRIAEIKSSISTQQELEDMIAETFSTSTNYSIGDYVIYHNTANNTNELYRFKVEHTGSWDSSHVTKVELADELQEQLDDKATIIQELVTGEVPLPPLDESLETPMPYGASTGLLYIREAERVIGRINWKTSGTGADGFYLLNIPVPANASIYFVNSGVSSTVYGAWVTDKKIIVPNPTGTYKYANDPTAIIKPLNIGDNRIQTLPENAKYISICGHKANYADYHVYILPNNPHTISTKVEQTLTDTQKAMARNNIDAAANGDISNLQNNKQDILTFDSSPIEDSANPITSDGVFKAVESLNNEIDTELNTLNANINKKAPGIFNTITNAFVAECNMCASQEPLQAFNINIVPTQSGTGAPSPTNIRPITGNTNITIHHTGKNLCSGFTKTTASAGVAKTNYMPVDFNLHPDYYMSGLNADVTNWAFAYDKDFNFIGRTDGKKDRTATHLVKEAFTGDDTVNNIIGTHIYDSIRYICYRYYNAGDYTAEQLNASYPQFEPSVERTEYEPYIEDIEISLPSENNIVYYGTFDAIQRILTITHKKITFTGAETWKTVSNSNYIIRYTEIDDIISPHSLGTYADGVCSHYQLLYNCSKDDVGVNAADKTYWYANSGYSPTPQRVYFKDSNYTSQASFQAYVQAQNDANTPIELVYRLETPLTYNLTSPAITIEKGLNTFWTTNGSINTIKYNVDVQKYIENVNTNLQTAQSNIISKIDNDISTLDNAKQNILAQDLLTNTDNLNSIIQNGIYYFTQDSIPANVPLGVTNGILSVLSPTDSTTNYKTQVLTVDNYFYYRYNFTSGWGQWVRIAGENSFNLYNQSTMSGTTRTNVTHNIDGTITVTMKPDVDTDWAFVNIITGKSNIKPNTIYQLSLEVVSAEMYDTDGNAMTPKIGMRFVGNMFGTTKLSNGISTITAPGKYSASIYTSGYEQNLRLYITNDQANIASSTVTVKNIMVAECPQKIQYVPYGINITDYGARSLINGVQNNTLSWGKSNFQARVRQFVNVKYTPVEGLPSQFKSVNNEFPQNKEVMGVPYSSARGVDKLIGIQVNLYTFLSAIKNPRSVIYTRKLTYNNARTYYGCVCSAFLNYIFNENINLVTAELQDWDKLTPITFTELDIGDVLLTQGHVKVVYDITRDEYGRINNIVIAEAGDPVVKWTAYTWNSFLNATPPGSLSEDGKYVARRYANINGIEYTQQPEVKGYLDETIIEPIYPDIMSEYGDKAAIIEGEDILINVIDSTDYSSIEIWRDNELQQTITTLEDFTIEDAAAGTYEIKMIGTTKETSTQFIVVNANCSYDPSTKILTFQSSNATPSTVYRWANSNNAPSNRYIPLTEEQLKSGIVNLTDYMTDERTYIKVAFKTEFGIATWVWDNGQNIKYWQSV